MANDKEKQYYYVLNELFPEGTENICLADVKKSLESVFDLVGKFTICDIEGLYFSIFPDVNGNESNDRTVNRTYNARVSEIFGLTMISKDGDKFYFKNPAISLHEVYNYGVNPAPELPAFVMDMCFVSNGENNIRYSCQKKHKNVEYISSYGVEKTVSITFTSPEEAPMAMLVFGVDKFLVTKFTIKTCLRESTVSKI